LEAIRRQQCFATSTSRESLDVGPLERHSHVGEEDETTSVREREMTGQPAVYPFIGQLARRFDCARLVDLGLGDPAGLGALAKDFELLGLANPEIIAQARERLPSASLLDWIADTDLPVEVEGAAVVCSLSESRLQEAPQLLEAVQRNTRGASVVVVSAPANAPLNLGSLDPELAGVTVTAEGSPVRDTSLAVLSRDEDTPVPEVFSVVAFVTTFNEADLIGSTIDQLAREGVGVYLIDNWSTDGTWELVQGLGLVGAERFPPDGPSPHYEWRHMLDRVEELAISIRADWLIHVDADERRESAWPGVSLRDGLWRVDRRAFNAVDHTILTFPPVDDGFQPGSDPERYFHHFEFGRNPGHFRQIKAWKRGSQRVDLASEGGHDVSFEGRRIFPFNFLSKHYPIRSQAHGERKIFHERQERWSPAERAGGWHIQYDHLQPGHYFVRDPETLEIFDDFHSRYLVERLTRVGIPRPEWPPS
jgi:hypothetical protein